MARPKKIETTDESVTDEVKEVLTTVVDAVNIVAEDVKNELVEAVSQVATGQVSLVDATNELVADVMEDIKDAIEDIKEEVAEVIEHPDFPSYDTLIRRAAEVKIS